MAIKVRIPTPLRRCTNQKDEVEADGANIKEVLDNLEKQYPELRERVRGEDGKVRKFIVIYLNDEDMRFMESEETPVKDGDVMSILPAIAGGNRPI